MKLKRKAIILIAVLTFLAAPVFLSAETGDNLSLPKHFTSRDGYIEFDYPQWWAISPIEENYENVNGIVISNSPSYLEEDYMEPGIFAVRIMYGRISALSDEIGMQWPGPYDIHTFMIDDLGSFSSDQYVPLNTESLYIDNKPAFLTILGNYDSDFIVITFTSDRNFCVFTANVYPGELAKHAPPAMEIAESLKLQ